jgi:hypothetical protein
VQQIAEWLEKLGMSEYAQRFVDSDIDIEVLGELTDADFDRLGVSIGHRRKLLKALAAGVADAAPPVSTVGAHLTPVPSQTAERVPSTEAAAGERRHVTVMFCDLVDSTGIAARLDAEEWRDLVRISHTTECIGVANQRKPLCRNNSSSIRGAPRCRQSVAGFLWI